MTAETQTHSTLSAVAAARQQLAWVPLKTLLECVDYARHCKGEVERVVAITCDQWAVYEPGKSRESMESDVRALMVLAKHGD